MVRSPVIPWVLLIAGILVGLWLYRADARNDAEDELLKQQALERAESYAEALDSVEVETAARGDSLRASETEKEQLRANMSALERRYLALRAETNEAIQPDFTFSGTDSALAVRVDEQLRSRLPEADTLRAIRPLPHSRFDTPRPLLVDYVHLVMTTLPALEMERRTAEHLNDLKEDVIRAQDEHLALTERQLASTAESLNLCKSECSEYRDVVEIQEGQISRLKWWRRSAQVIAISWGVREVLR